MKCLGFAARIGKLFFIIICSFFCQKADRIPTEDRVIEPLKRLGVVGANSANCGIIRQFLAKYFAAHVNATEQYVRRMRESDPNKAIIVI